MSRRLRAATLAATLLFSTPTVATTPAHAAPEEEPHSPVGRKASAPKVTRTRTAVVRDVDLGDIDLGPASRPKAYRAPVRGLLITPRRARANAPLVVFGHLRMPGCSTMVATYPCPRGSQEMRYDRGMRWYGESLAARGYAVLIPDLAPIYSPQELSTPYSQQKAWLTAVGRLRDQAVAGDAGRRSAWGTGLRGMIDGHDTTLVVHSRSAYMVNGTIDAWRRSSTPIGQVMAYGGAHDTPSTDGTPTPIRANIPFLGVAGTADADVENMGSQWFTAVIGAPRTAPAFQVEVEDYGHAYINRELSRRGLDDRRGEVTRTAKDHEKLLLDTTVGWLSHTVRGRHVFPTGNTEPLPNGLIGVPARYLVATHGRAVRLVSGKGRWAAPLGRGASVKVCRNVGRMDPTPYPDRCPNVDDGVPISDSLMTRVRLGRGTGARVTVTARHPKLVALHLTPTRDRKDKLGHTPMRLTAVMADGRRFPVDMGPKYNALREWPHPYGAGLYYPQTARVPLPAAARRGTLVAVELTGPRGGEVDIRGLDVVAG